MDAQNDHLEKSISNLQEVGLKSQVRPRNCEVFIITRLAIFNQLTKQNSIMILRCNLYQINV